MSGALRAFRDYLSFLGRSESTIRRYMYVVRDFVEFCGGSPRFTREAVIGYISGLRERGFSGTYQKFAYAVLSRFFRALSVPWPFEKGESPKASEPNRPYFTLEEIRAILDYVDTHANPRDRALIRVAATVGCRRMELQRMNREDFDQENCRIYIRTGKRGKPRWRRLDPETCNALKRYLASRDDDEPALFRSRRGGRISLVELSRILRKYLVGAGIRKPGAGYHSFRRGLVTILHSRGISERELQEWMGWQTPFMPHQYIQLMPTKVEEKVTKVHPLFHGREGAEKR